MESQRRSSRWNLIPVPDRVMQRAHSKWEPNDADCWISTYSTGSHGYAQIGWDNGGGMRHVVLAHRASWEFEYGPTPEGMTLDHMCKQKKCVNPSHLRVLSNFENARRTDGRDWPLGECVSGHPNSMLRVKWNGNLECSECRRQWSRRYEQKKKLAALAAL